MLNFLIKTQKLYFCDRNAFYDVIMQETVRKRRHNHRHEISRVHLLKYHSFRPTQQFSFQTNQQGLFCHLQTNPSYSLLIGSPLLKVKLSFLITHCLTVLTYKLIYFFCRFIQFRHKASFIFCFKEEIQMNLFRSIQKEIIREWAYVLDFSKFSPVIMGQFQPD